MYITVILLYRLFIGPYVIWVFFLRLGLDDGGLMIDEVSELRTHLEREQSLRVELEEQLKEYAARLGETFVNIKPKENTQTTIQYHHTPSTVSASYNTVHFIDF